MIELDNRALQFLESIREEGERSCETIRTDTDQRVAAALAQTRAEEQDRADKSLQFETARAAVAANRALSAAREAARARLSAHRDELTEAVFADARAALAQFADSPAYGPWLAESAAALAAKTGDATVLYARTADLPLLAGKLPAGTTLQPDDTITLGGLKAAGSRLAADDTLESRLAAQRGWFLETSGLAVTL